MTGVSFRLVPIDAGAPPVDSLRVPRPDDEGHFTFENVAAGHYGLVGHAAVFERRPGTASTFLSYWASTEVVLSGGAPASVALTLQPGVTLSGRIILDGTASTVPNDVSQVGVRLTPRDSLASVSHGVPGNVADRTNPDGSFTIRGVPPGHYTVSAFVNRELMGGWDFESATMGGADVADVPLTVSARDDINGIEIRVSDSHGELEGTLTDRSGRPTADGVVIVFPPDERVWRTGARRIRATRPDTSGVFALRGLPVGEYLVAAVPDIEQDGWLDPAVLATLRPDAVPVAVARTTASITVSVR